MPRKFTSKGDKPKPSKARKVMLQLRVSREEHTSMKAAAKTSALTLSGWARSHLVQLARQENTK